MLTNRARPTTVGEALDRAENEAWERYGQACHDPLATDEQRWQLFRDALCAMHAAHSKKENQ